MVILFAQELSFFSDLVGKRNHRNIVVNKLGVRCFILIEQTFSQGVAISFHIKFFHLVPSLDAGLAHLSLTYLPAELKNLQQLQMRVSSNCNELPVSNWHVNYIILMITWQLHIFVTFYGCWILKNINKTLIDTGSAFMLLQTGSWLVSSHYPDQCWFVVNITHQRLFFY